MHPPATTALPVCRCPGTSTDSLGEEPALEALIEMDGRVRLEYAIIKTRLPERSTTSVVWRDALEPGRENWLWRIGAKRLSHCSDEKGCQHPLVP